MLRRAFLALAVLLFLVPGNLLAAAMAGGRASCEDQGCCCPAPSPDKPGKAWTQKCCCEALPAPEPDKRPADPLQKPAEAFGAELALPEAACGIPSALPLREWLGERPVHPAQAPPDPLFLRYHNLRL